jgi:hypothetical protein
MQTVNSWLSFLKQGESSEAITKQFCQHRRLCHYLVTAKLRFSPDFLA